MFDDGANWVRQAVPSPAALSPAALVDVMADLHRLESVLVERKLAAIAEFTGHRQLESADPTEWVATGWEVAESEVGAALTVGRFQAGRLMDIATCLRDRLPRVRAAMASGQLDLYRVMLVEAATRNVDAELIDEVDAVPWPRSCRPPARKVWG